jgi:predicted PurR-regulated permease PerM
MSEPTQRAGSGGRGFLLTLASLVVVIAGLKAAAVFFLPLLLALFLTILAFPLFTSLRRHRAPAWLAIAVTMLVMAALVGMVGLVITISVEDLTEKLPEYSDEARAATLRTIDWLEDHRVTVPRQITTEALDPLEWGAIAQFVGSTFRGVATALSAFLLVLLTMVFMLWEAVIFPGKLRAAARSGPIDLERWTAIVQRVQRYLILKTLVSLATGALVTLLVWPVRRLKRHSLKMKSCSRLASILGKRSTSSCPRTSVGSRNGVPVMTISVPPWPSSSSQALETWYM